MTLSEWLIKRARRYWVVGAQLPLDLFYEMLSAGLDVSALEEQFIEEAL